MNIVVPDLSASIRQAAFVCKELPSVLFRGRVNPSSILRGRDHDEYDVQISLVGPWTLDFFGISDGMEDAFLLARVPAESNGVFEMQLPDFTQDETLKAAGVEDAALHFSLRERKTGNNLATLQANTTWKKTNDLPLRPTYGDEVSFEAH
jgi:hypothetical protein